MSNYFDFNYVTDPPNDEKVSVVDQLNDNWQELDDKLTVFNQLPANFGAFAVPIGTEAYDPDPAHAEPDRIAVWTGSIWARGISAATAWGQAWQTIAIRSPLVIRTGFPVKARINNVIRCIQLTGGVYVNATQDAWNTATTYEITTDTAIQSDLAPVNGMHIQQCAAGAITTANGFASSVVTIEPKTSPSRTSISVRYQGDAGGGNFISLDNVRWWY